MQFGGFGTTVKNFRELEGEKLMTTKTITIEKEFGGVGPDGKPKNVTYSKSGPCTVVESNEDVLTLLSQDASAKVEADASPTEIDRIKKRTLKAINYAFDLWARAKLTQALNSEHVDPNKALEKAFEQSNKARLAMGLKPYSSIERFKEIQMAA